MSEVGRRPRRTGRRSRRRAVEMDLSDSDIENTDPSGMRNDDGKIVDTVTQLCYFPNSVNDSFFPSTA